MYIYYITHTLTWPRAPLQDSGGRKSGNRASRASSSSGLSCPSSVEEVSQARSARRRFFEWGRKVDVHRIGWWENLQETPIFDGKQHLNGLV